VYGTIKALFFAANSRKRLRGCLLSAVELECDKNGGLREVGVEAVFQEVADLALPLVDLGSLGRDSLEKSLQVNILEKLKNLELPPALCMCPSVLWTSWIRIC
jgi:hypothetical protein